MRLLSKSELEHALAAGEFKVLAWCANVALTRARRKLIVVADSATIAAHPFYQRLLAYFETIGAYHSVWEENDG